MTNSQIAEIFYNISKMLEIKGGNKFRAIAYENAAQEIENLAEDVADIYKKSGIKALDEIEGVGSNIALKIQELIKTGRIKAYESLKKQIPLEMVILTQVPGIGPKTTQKLYKKLKIKSIKDLKKAAEQGRISKLPGFDTASEQNIIKGIAQLKKFTKEKKRMLLPTAFLIAQEALDFLKKEKEVKKCDAVGSLRRMKETIGDIDIIVGTKNPKKVIANFIKAPFIKRVLAKGNTKCSVIHKRGARMDLEVLGLENYTSLLQHFTGSKEHNVALRTLAKDKGLRISEYGIKNLKTKKIYKPENEKAFYNFLKMQYIPPELRENRGEIETALSKQLRRLIELKDIKGDLHVHSNKSDGNMTYKELAELGIERGYEYLCISDHTRGLGVVNGLTPKELLKEIRAIKALNKKYRKIRLLAGCEANIEANGKIDMPDSVLSKLDVVIASVHGGFNQSKRAMTNRIINAIKNPHVDIIGHPTGRLIGQRGPYEADWPEIFKAAAKHKTALEINAFPTRLDLKDILIQEARKYKVKFAINTDSHQREHFDNLIYGAGTARRGWVEKNEVINCLKLKELLSWLK